METATGFGLFLRSAASGMRHLVTDIGPWILVWLLVASPFLWLLTRLRNEERTLVGSLAISVGFALLIAGVCSAIHFVLAFGEAFDGGIDRDRVRAFVGLTIAFIVISTFWLRMPRHAKKA